MHLLHIIKTHIQFTSLHAPPFFQLFFFFNDTATTEIYTLSLHDALPIRSAWTFAGVDFRSASWQASRIRLSHSATIRGPTMYAGARAGDTGAAPGSAVSAVVAEATKSGMPTIHLCARSRNASNRFESSRRRSLLLRRARLISRYRANT